MLKAAVPEIHVSTAAAARQFYSDKLGFTCANAWRPDETKDDPCYMSFVRDGVRLQVTSFKGTLGTCVYVYVDDVDTLHAEFASRGVTIARAICDQPYGCRDFDIEDCNGYRLCFGHDLGTA